MSIYANASSMAHAGEAYEKSISRFTLLAKALKEPSRMIPSLILESESDGMLQFSFMGKPYTLVHSMENLDSEWFTFLDIYIRDLFDNRKHTLACRMFMDNLGNVGQRLFHRPLNISQDFERIFLLLLLGAINELPKLFTVEFITAESQRSNI